MTDVLLISGAGRERCAKAAERRAGELGALATKWCICSVKVRWMRTSWLAHQVRNSSLRVESSPTRRLEFETSQPLRDAVCAGVESGALRASDPGRVA